MRAASAFEIAAARVWNVFNEGKTFYPIFAVGALVLFRRPQWEDPTFWLGLGGALAASSPLLAAFVRYDFPLHLRAALWLLAGAAAWLLWPIDWRLAGWVLGLYLFFTVFLWGTLYYHLRIGAPWSNWLRFWRLVLINQDSTSGNFLEQMPKAWITTAGLNWAAPRAAALAGGGAGARAAGQELLWYMAGGLLAGLVAWAAHRLFLTWRPVEYPAYASAPTGGGGARRVIMVVIDGCRVDRLAEAKTPFLDDLARRGTVFTRMETIYPARTVCCFSSFFTGTYPREHGITSNFVWRLGVRCESVFERLAKSGKKGVLFGIAHLIDAFGAHVQSVSAVMPNDVADRHILTRARQIMAELAPDFLVVQLIAVDQTGHSRGPLGREYREKIEAADGLIAEFYGWLGANGYLDEAIFMVCADHGQSDGIGGHGHLGPGERFVPFIVAGEQIAAGRAVTTPHSIVSVAATVCYWLGVPPPDRARGPVLVEAMERTSGLLSEGS